MTPVWWTTGGLMCQTRKLVRRLEDHAEIGVLSDARALVCDGADGFIHAVHGLSSSRVATRHKVRVHPQREPRFVVPEVVTQRLDVLAGVQQDRRVEVPERVHTVLACRLVTFTRPRLGDRTGGDEGGLPNAVVEMGPSDRARPVQRVNSNWRVTR